MIAQKASVTTTTTQAAPDTVVGTSWDGPSVWTELNWRQNDKLS